MRPLDVFTLNRFYRSLSDRSKMLFHPPFFQTTSNPRWLIHQASLFLSSVDPVKPLLKRVAPSILHTLFIAFFNNRVVGLAYLRRLKKETRSVELGIGVLDEYQGMGIGSSLLSTALNMASKEGKDCVYLMVSCENKRAIAFYKKFGFVIFKRIPRGDTWFEKALDVFEMKLYLKKVFPS